MATATPRHRSLACETQLGSGAELVSFFVFVHFFVHFFVHLFVHFFFVCSYLLSILNAAF